MSRIEYISALVLFIIFLLNMFCFLMNWTVTQARVCYAYSMAQPADKRLSVEVCTEAVKRARYETLLQFAMLLGVYYVAASAVSDAYDLGAMAVMIALAFNVWRAYNGDTRFITANDEPGQFDYHCKCFEVYCKAQQK